jgi:alkanesulfonate monooxygenase SsuD/methylene tetrahydromethanopterin reductase-like flavin-dependent oxidoreductase (luciferase family)
MRVGVRVAQYGSDWPNLRDGALHAESLGFESIWVNDHLCSPGRLADEAAFDAFVTLAALAPQTTRARLGIVVLSAAYRPAPLAAKMATLLDVISDGRLTIGLGTGSHKKEHHAYGFPFGSPHERSAGFEHALDVMRAMFEHPEGANVPGALSDAPNQPPPVQKGGPPIWVAAHKKRLLGIAGAKADGIIAAFVDPDELSRRLEIAREAHAGAGRRRPLECAVYTFALAGSEREQESWLTPEADALGTTPRQLLRWLRTTGLVDSIDGVRERLAALEAVGTSQAIFCLPSRTPPDALEALAEATLDE